MTIQPITAETKDAYNKVVSHPLQSYEWGAFRERTGTKVIRRGFFEEGKLLSGFTLTIHTIPKTSWTIGYLPKGTLPSKELVATLKQIGKQENCIFIQLEPNIQIESGKLTLPADRQEIVNSNLNLQLSTLSSLIPAAHPLFTKYTFQLDLTKSETELLAAMHPKTRYNIKVAKKHGVEVSEDNSEKAFKRYWELTEETTKRQKFYAHTKRYHELQWKIFSSQKIKDEHRDTNTLSYHLFTAHYEGKTLTTMVFYVFHDTLYYPYGASSDEHRNVMHSTLTMWEAILYGKKLGLKKFDMWGAMGPEPDQNDPWFGFHTFKERFGPDHVEFIGSYDLVINPVLYQGYKLADKLRWYILKKKK